MISTKWYLGHQVAMHAKCNTVVDDNGLLHVSVGQPTFNEYRTLLSLHFLLKRNNNNNNKIETFQSAGPFESRLICQKISFSGKLL
jgi:hypothetical protein